VPRISLRRDKNVLPPHVIGKRASPVLAGNETRKNIRHVGSFVSVFSDDVLVADAEVMFHMVRNNKSLVLLS
jgi:hypothetical protein